jgi:long-chain acyl-CoA synthetase
VLPNCPQNVIAFFAALRLGAVVVQHNPLYTEAELRHQLADCGATVVVCLDRVYAPSPRCARDTQLKHVVVTSIADYLPTRPSSSSAAARQGQAGPRRDHGEHPEGRACHAVPVAAQGHRGCAPGAARPGGRPRAAAVHRRHDRRLEGRDAHALQPREQRLHEPPLGHRSRRGKEVSLAVLPLFHAYGLTVAMNATVLLGGTLVLLPRFDIDQVFAAIDEWKPTMFPGVPPIYKALADSPKVRSHDLRSIRLCVSGAMKLPTEIQEQFERVSGASLVEGYGMTETSPSTHCNPVGGTRKPGRSPAAAGHAAARSSRRTTLGRGAAGGAGRARDLGPAVFPRLLGARAGDRRVHPTTATC